MQRSIFACVWVLLALTQFPALVFAEARDLIPYRTTSGKWGYCDKEKRIIIQPRYDEAEFFRSARCAWVKKGKKWGMIDSTGKEIIAISEEQMHHFAGNMLQVQGASGQTFLVISKTAFNSLTKEQINRIEQHTNILTPDIETIETYGGGSVRCMMAEIFLPEKSLT